jgi:hypothetical protein
MKLSLIEESCEQVVKWHAISQRRLSADCRLFYWLIRHSIQLKKITALHHCFDIPTMELHTMSLQCPRCNSPKIASFHQAMKIAAAIGTVGGAARGVSAALAGGQAGATVGVIAGPLGVTLGAVSGAILGGLVGGAGGCALGAQLGDKLDRHVLAHNLCLICGHRFNLPA